MRPRTKKKQDTKFVFKTHFERKKYKPSHTLSTLIQIWVASEKCPMSWLNIFLRGEGEFAEFSSQGHQNQQDRERNCLTQIVFEGICLLRLNLPWESGVYCHLRKLQHFCHQTQTAICTGPGKMGNCRHSNSPGTGARGSACSAVAQDRRGLSSSLHSVLLEPANAVKPVRIDMI